MRDAVVTVSPNRQYRGMIKPTTPATHGPVAFKHKQTNVKCDSSDFLKEVQQNEQTKSTKKDNVQEKHVIIS